VSRRNIMSEREEWNKRYSAGVEARSEPDPLLISAYEQYIDPLLARQGRALDLAGGVGRHAIWLAQRGWDVDLLDVSEQGIEIARQRAQEAGVEVHFLQQDLTQGLPEKTYDLILDFFYLERSLFLEIPKALKPEGILVFKTYTQLHPVLTHGQGPKHPMHLLAPNELLHAFEAFDVLYYRETVKDKGVAELVARKPEEQS
jgi:tellurite methyltransferase